MGHQAQRSKSFQKNTKIKKIENGKTDSGRVAYISVVNVISAIAVVIMHANVSFWLECKTPFWPASNVIESLFYFAVPVFYMLSGATLIDYRDRCTTKEYFIRRFKKAVIPFMVWCVVGWLWAYRKTLWAMLIGKPNTGLDWTFTGGS